MKDAPSTAGADQVIRHIGRPRSETADDAILRAAIDLLAERGIDGTTIQAVASRAGVARATIYLRWPGRDALIGAAIRRAIGRDPYPLTGDLETDIRGGGQQARAIFSEAAFASIVPALIRELLARDGPARVADFDVLFPNRRRLADEYRLLARDQGFRDDIDAEGVTDLVAGALLMRLLATGKAPSREFTKDVADLVIESLRAERVRR
jgi:AcrR family transcriptional regulator